MIRLERFFEIAASSGGVERMSARSGGINPAATRGFTIGGEDTCLEELVSHGTVVSLLWEHQRETVGEGDTAEKEVSLLSKVVFADELDEGGQGEDDLLD